MIEIENITSQCYKVLVRCYTYNHGQYIQDALNGFSMQQTNFPFVCLVMDDCSTDGEQEVIKAYLDHECDIAHAKFYEDDTANLIIVSHGTNASCTFAIYLLKRNLYKEKGAKKAYVNPWRELCTYEALCEGDDYWTDPYKLQKQVDFLESHEDYSMCFHAAGVLNENNTPVYIHCTHIEEKEYHSNDIFPRWIVPTASVVYRIESVSKYVIRHRGKILYGDICTFLTCAEVGKIWGMAERMSVYRINSGGVTQQDKRPDYRKWAAHEECLKMNFPSLDKKMLNRNIASYYYSLFRNDHSVVTKIHDFSLAFMNSPSYVVGKIRALVCRVLKIKII